jgi:hypothetical protein
MSGFCWTAPTMCAAYAATGHAGRHMVIFLLYQIRWPRSNISPSTKISMLFNITLSIHQASFEFVKLKLLMFKAKSYKITDVRCGDKFGGLKQRERTTCIAHRYVCSLSITIGYIIYYWQHHSLLATRSQSSAS